MRLSLQRLSLANSVLVILLFVACVMVVLSRDSERIAHAASTECRVVLALDNSRSVGDDHWITYKNQVNSLFGFDAIKDFKDHGITDLRIAFWTFSHIDDGTNFNRYHYDYVREDGTDGNLQQQFQSYLNNSTKLDGGYTNYAQGFAYDVTGTNPLTMVPNSNSDIARIAHGNGDPDVIGLITDGAPNHPGTLDGNDSAISAAYQARQKYPNTKFFAGFINPNSDPIPILSRSINGSPTPPSPSNVGPIQITSGSSSLSAFLIEGIKRACGGTTTTPSGYSLVPSIQASPLQLDSGQSTSLELKVDNPSPNDKSNPTNWKVVRLTVPPSGNTTKLTNYGTPPYHDGGSCNWLQDQVTGVAKKTDIICEENIGMSSTQPQSFDQGYTPLKTYPSIMVSGDPGTQVCYVLVLAKPTQNATPVDRYSPGTCVTIREPKDPAFVQITGGDLRVGRNFSGTTGATGTEQVLARTILGSDSKTYGSWVEYGIIAPGPVNMIASLSDYSQGSRDSWSCKPERPNKLTFANTASTCGNFGNEDEVGYIPNVAGPFTEGTSQSISGSVPVPSNTGLYSSGGDLTITGGTVAKGKTVIIKALGTVTISGDIQYADGYSNIADIPQLVIVANNIVIGKNVNQVSAWLIANGTDGKISTCNDSGAGNIYMGNLSKGVCNSGQALKIDGPVMAKHLYLRRTFGAGSNGTPAEIINLPGTAYLWACSWADCENTHNGSLQTTFTTELPPYF